MKRRRRQTISFNAMREIIIVERTTVTENGQTVLRERKVHGLQDDDGAFRLLFYGGKRIVSPQKEGGSYAQSA